MSKTIQIRDVPDQVYNTLKARAAREGMSLSDFIKQELARATEYPRQRRPGSLKGRLQVEGEFFEALPAEELSAWE